MVFINPIVILGLAQTDVSAIDSSVIKKAKRMVLAEIELSDDGEIAAEGAMVRKTDVDEAVASISNLTNIRLYHLIANDRPLQKFLSASNENFFYDYERKPEYRTQEFLALVGPYFVKSYSEALRNAYTLNKHQLLQSILSMIPLCSQDALDGLYEGVREAIGIQLQEVNRIAESIPMIDPDFQKDLISSIPKKAMNIVNCQSLNILPTQLQTLRNKCASAIRHLAVEVFNELDEEKIARDLLKYATSILVDGMVRVDLEKDSFKIMEIVLQREKRRSVEPTIRKAATFVKNAIAKIEAMQNGKGDSSEILNWVVHQIDVSEIDKLDSEFTEIKDHVALTLRALSVECWNSNNDLKNATMLIAKASSMKTISTEAKANISAAASSLASLKFRVPTVTYVPQQKKPLLPQNTDNNNKSQEQKNTGRTNKPVAQSRKSSDLSWIEKNPALAISLSCFAIGGLILAAGGGWFGGVIILLGVGFLKAI